MSKRMDIIGDYCLEFSRRDYYNGLSSIGLVEKKESIWKKCKTDIFYVTSSTKKDLIAEHISMALIRRRA